MDPIASILEEGGPASSSAIAIQLQAAFSISPEAARKRLSRARPPIRSFPIPLLPKGERFLYLQDQRGSEAFWINFLSAMRQTGSVYAFAVDALAARGGVIPVNEFPVICGAPHALKGQVPANLVLRNLTEAGFLRPLTIEAGDVVTLARPEFGAVDLSGFSARRATEGIVLDAVREWARKLGFGSYDAITIRGDDAELRVGQFRWDITGPSYLVPVRGSKGRNGFLVADVFVEGILSEHEIAYFLRKVALLKATGNVGFLPILVADGFSKAALSRGKGTGIVMATPANLFGERVGQSLQTLLQTLKNAAAIASANPTKLAALIENLAEIEGAAGNLRGILFELIVAHLARLSAASIDFAVRARDPSNGKVADIDVLKIINNGECVAIECKGKNPGGEVGLEEVDDWVARLSTFRAHLSAQDRFRHARQSFEIWTSGSFTTDAVEKLEYEKRRRVRFPIAWKDGNAVAQIARESRERAIRVALDNHFFRHPLA